MKTLAAQFRSDSRPLQQFSFLAISQYKSEGRPKAEYASFLAAQSECPVSEFRASDYGIPLVLGLRISEIRSRQTGKMGIPMDSPSRGPVALAGFKPKLCP